MFYSYWVFVFLFYFLNCLTCSSIIGNRERTIKYTVQFPIKYFYSLLEECIRIKFSFQTLYQLHNLIYTAINLISTQKLEFEPALFCINFQKYNVYKYCIWCTLALYLFINAVYRLAIVSQINRCLFSLKSKYMYSQNKKIIYFDGRLTTNWCSS